MTETQKVLRASLNRVVNRARLIKKYRRLKKGEHPNPEKAIEIAKADLMHYKKIFQNAAQRS
ncbi:hypothetical protein ACFL3M_03885 [Patescibacteria group bacterium]